MRKYFSEKNPRAYYQTITTREIVKVYDHKFDEFGLEGRQGKEQRVIVVVLRF